jgi:guanosine-3',5'-bis(diphosphate) 3'-pyrophosphohydrolase
MIYTNLTRIAMRLAYDAHKEQLDKAGLPYIYHPIHLAEQMDDESSTIVALLHDVIEDSDLSIKDIETMGFPIEVIEALNLLTHPDSIDYIDYIKTISKHPLASKVKLADLRHNSDMSRLEVILEKDVERIHKYVEAIHVLTREND